MQSSKTVTSDNQEVDVESFIDTESSVNLGDFTGTARLKSCDVAENPSCELPQPYIDRFSGLTHDEYFVFGAEMVGDCPKDIQVVLPADESHDEMDIVYGWTDADSISGLAGSKVPVRHISEDVYRVKGFDGMLSGLFSAKKTVDLVERDIFEYQQNSWGINSRILMYAKIAFSMILSIVFAYGMLNLVGWLPIAVGLVFLWMSFLYKNRKKR